MGRVSARSAVGLPLLAGAALVALWPLLGCAEEASGPASIEPVQAFADANAQLVEIVEQRLASDRSAYRLQLLRYAVTDHILSGGERVPAETLAFVSDWRGPSGQAPHDQATLDALLCQPRVPHAQTAAHSAYLAAASAGLQRLSKEPADEFGPLLAALFRSYDGSIDEPRGDAEIRGEVLAVCRADIESHAATVYGVPGGRAESGFIAAAVGLYEVVREVLLPVATAGLQEVDRARRAAALRRFLAAPENRARLDAALAALDGYLDDQLARERHVQLLAVLRRQAALLSAVGDVSTTAACDGVAELGTDDPAQAAALPAFQSCHDALWHGLDDAPQAYLVAAAQYDGLADADPAGAVQAVRGAMAGLVEASTVELDPAALVSAMVRLIAVAEKLESATSPDSRQKLKQAIDRLLDSF